MRDGAVYIAGLGANTAIGRSAWACAAAKRAAVTGFTQHPYMVDSAGEPMRVAMASWLEVGLKGTDRLEALLFPAIDAAVAPVDPQALHPLRVGLALGLASQRPGVPADVESELSRRVRSRYGSLFSALAVFANGHASGLVGLRKAVSDLARGELDACVLAGVDSYMDPDALEWLEEQDQLHGAGPFNNAWGFIPGEGGGAVLLVRDEVPQALRAGPPLARVLGCGVAIEPKTTKSRSVCTGEGLAAALRSALTALPADTRVTDVYCDLNGEPDRADEYAFAGLRTSDAFSNLSEFVAPADCWGDVGAAGGALHLALAVVAGVKGYARGATALACGSSETGERGAVLLSVSRR